MRPLPRRGPGTGVSSKQQKRTWARLLGEARKGSRPIRNQGESGTQRRLGLSTVQGRWALPGSLRAKLGRLQPPTVQVLLDSRRMGARVGQADLKESLGAWEKCQKGPHLGHHLMERERETRTLPLCSLAGVKQNKTYMLPRETPGLARAGKGIQGLRLQESCFSSAGTHTGRLRHGRAWGGHA